MDCPFLSIDTRKERAFSWSLIICIILVYIMSLYIWDIEVLGGSKYTPEAILKFLSENNIKAGIKKKNIDGRKLRKK